MGYRSEGKDGLLTAGRSFVHCPRVITERFDPGETMYILKKDLNRPDMDHSICIQVLIQSEGRVLISNR